jgi:hypothetical protein
MASRRQRDELAELLRWCAAGLRRRAARLGGRAVEWVFRQLPFSWVLHAVGVPIFLAGMACGFGGALIGLASAWTTGFALPTTEFPLVDPRGVAADPHGRLFVADAFHVRVQRYSRDGRFERGWFIPRKVRGVRTTADGRVVVNAEGGPRTYSGDGELLDGPADPREDSTAAEPSGRYAVRHGLTPGVIDTQTGRSALATPWPLRLIATPFPAVLYFAIGVALVALGDWRRSREGLP